MEYNQEGFFNIKLKIYSFKKKYEFMIIKLIGNSRNWKKHIYVAKLKTKIV